MSLVNIPFDFKDLQQDKLLALHFVHFIIVLTFVHRRVIIPERKSPYAQWVT